MQKLIKFIILSFIPIAFVLLFLLFLNTLFLDFKYAHKSLVTYQKPFDWAMYKLEINFLKFVRDLKNNKKIGLDERKIFISEKSQKSLLSNVPMSTKLWQNGFYLTQTNELKKIRVRYRGDNPRNWLFEKKNIRIKSRKKNQFGRYRYFDYDPFRYEKFVSGSIASSTGVISPNFQLIELFVNDNSQGIYIQTEKINENFLRRNRIMPVNIYKGEQINSESIIKTNNNLFNNHAIWKKAAIFNKINKNDKSDLINFLDLLRKSENDFDSYNKLMNSIDLIEWGKFAAYQIITDNYHNDYGHNMRLIFDPWSGKLRPVIYDPILGENIFKKNKIDFNNSSHGLMLFLNKNSLFIDKKYNELFNFVSVDKIIDKEIRKLKSLEKKILISENRDVEIQRVKFNNLDLIKKINPFNILRLSASKERLNVMKNLATYNQKLKNEFFIQPKASWSFLDEKLNIKINGNMPISNIKILFKKEIPKWIYIDLNKDGIINKNEKFTPDSNGAFFIPITLYANRVVVAENKNELGRPKIITTNTRFDFIIENSIRPEKIEVQNSFSKKKFFLKNDINLSLPANKFNLPIVDSILEENTSITLDGIINVTSDLIFNQKVNIKAGTKFLLNKDVNIFFLNSINAIGTEKNPIIFKKSNEIENNKNNWGTIVVQGKNSRNSKFENIIIKGGTGAKVDQFFYTSMFSLHDTGNIILKNISLYNNKLYDDALHLIYCDNVLIDNILIKDAFSDAIDIDVSKKIIIKNSKFVNPKNDSIDVMESSVLIDSSNISLSGDKGISIGENSNVIVHNTYLHRNNTGIAVKDNSVAKVFYTDFRNNYIHVNNYQKNYQYGNGGKIDISKSNFSSNINNIKSDNKSSILIEDSTFNNQPNFENSNIKLTNQIDFNSNRSTVDNLNLNKIDTMFEFVENVKNRNLRGSDFNIN